jgi:acyl-CoA synthetase (AMP-forming)/AMP-acid ligase II
VLREDQLAHVAAAVASHHRLTPADRGYCCLPLFHVNAEVVGLLATLAAQACLVLDRKFSRRGFWGLIAAQRITWINAVPAIHHRAGHGPARDTATRSSCSVSPVSGPPRWSRSMMKSSGNARSPTWSRPGHGGETSWCQHPQTRS